MLLQLFKRGIEALDVSDLQDGAGPLSQRHQLLGLNQTNGDRFLDEERDAATKELDGQSVVVGGRDRKNRGIDQVE
jgi:hypothetical protein